jgi:hypothetical protein
MTHGIIIFQSRRYGIEASVQIFIYYVVSCGFVSRSAHDISAVTEVKLKMLIEKAAQNARTSFWILNEITKLCQYGLWNCMVESGEMNN